VGDNDEAERGGGTDTSGLGSPSSAAAEDRGAIADDGAGGDSLPQLWMSSLEAGGDRERGEGGDLGGGGRSQDSGGKGGIASCVGQNAAPGMHGRERQEEGEQSGASELLIISRPGSSSLPLRGPLGVARSMRDWEDGEMQAGVASSRPATAELGSISRRDRTRLRTMAMGALENLTAHLLFANAAPEDMFVIREGRGSLERSQTSQALEHDKKHAAKAGCDERAGRGHGVGSRGVGEGVRDSDCNDDSRLPGNEGGSAFQGEEDSLAGGAGERSGEKPRLRRAELIRIFEELDKNENSEISMAEFIKGLRQSEALARKLGMPVVSHQEHESRTVFQLLYGDMDADSSKSISFDEFCTYFQERGVAVDDEAEEGDAQEAQEAAVRNQEIA